MATTSMQVPSPQPSGREASPPSPSRAQSPSPVPAPSLRLVAASGSGALDPAAMPGTLSFGPDAEDLPRDRHPDASHRCRSRMELHLAARALQPARVQLVASMAAATDLEAALAGIVSRIRQSSPATDVLVLAGAVTPDLAASLASAGATIAGPGTGDQRPDEVRLSGADWQAWLRDAYGLVADELTERILARLAAADDRTRIADSLTDDGLLAHPQAVRRIRQITKALAGEEYRSPGAVAHEARRALAGLAAVTTLRWRPLPDVSLIKAAARLRAAPSLASAAGLSLHEIGILFAINAELAGAKVTVRASSGTPPRSASVHARNWAARRVAIRRGATVQTVDAAGAELLALAASAARAIAEAQAESLQFPQARLAAAIDTVDRLAPAARPDWLRSVDDQIRWQECAPWQVASQAAPIPPSLAVQLTRAIDEALIDRRTLDTSVRLSGDEQQSAEGLE